MLKSLLQHWDVNCIIHALLARNSSSFKNLQRAIKLFVSVKSIPESLKIVSNGLMHSQSGPHCAPKETGTRGIKRTTEGGRWDFYDPFRYIENRLFIGTRTRKKKKRKTKKEVEPAVFVAH